MIAFEETKPKSDPYTVSTNQPWFQDSNICSLTRALECQICYVGERPLDFYRLELCGHLSCTDCLYVHVSNDIEALPILEEKWCTIWDTNIYESQFQEVLPMIKYFFQLRQQIGLMNIPIKCPQCDCEIAVSDLLRLMIGRDVSDTDETTLHHLDSMKLRPLVKAMRRKALAGKKWDISRNCDYEKWDSAFIIRLVNWNFPDTWSNAELKIARISSSERMGKEINSFDVQNANKFLVELVDENNTTEWIVKSTNKCEVRTFPFCKSGNVENVNTIV